MGTGQIVRLAVVSLALSSLASIGIVGAGSDGTALADVDVEYSQGGAINGSAEGMLDVARIRWPAGPPERFEVYDAKAQLRVIQTTVNYTVMGGMGVEDPLPVVQQRDEWIDLPRGRVVVEWPDRDEYTLLSIDPHGFWEEDRGHLRLAVRVSDAHWAGPQFGGSGVPFWRPTANGPGETSGGISSWHRNIDIEDGGPLHLVDPMVLQLRGASITAADGQVVKLGPYLRVEESIQAPMGQVARTSKIMTEGFLVIQSGHSVVPLGGASLAAGNAQWNITGDTIMNGVSGSFRIGSRDGMLTQEALGLSGSFRLWEELAQGPRPADGDTNSVQATASGSFTLVAVDYIVQAVGPPSPSLVERALWATLALTALSLFVWVLKHTWVLLYTRIKEDEVLAHPKRAEIMSFVEQNPGCHVLRVAGDLGLARGVARHHVMVLERAGRLRRYRESGQNLLVPAGQPKAVAIRALAEEDPHVASICRIVDRDGVRRSELVAMLRDRYGVADPTARRWIGKAVRAGLVEEAGKGHAVTVREAS